MMRKRLARLVFGTTFSVTLLTATVALAQEGGTAPVVATDWRVAMAKALTMAVSAVSAAYAQARIGAAAAGTLAERPEAGINLIILQALPEIIVLLGFVIAFMIA